MPQRMHARPSAWAKVSSRLVAEWQAIITVWLPTLAACTVLTVQPSYDTPGPCSLAGEARWQLIA